MKQNKTPPKTQNTKPYLAFFSRLWVDEMLVQQSYFISLYNFFLIILFVITEGLFLYIMKIHS